MSSQHQASDRGPGVKQENGPTPKSEKADSAHDQAGLQRQLAGSMDGATGEVHASLLGDARFPAAQRQVMAARIGRVRGNRHLQRVIARTQSAIQRQQGGNAVSSRGSTCGTPGSAEQGGAIDECLLAERLQTLAAQGDRAGLRQELQAVGLTAAAGPAGYRLLLEPGVRGLTSLKREAEQLSGATAHLESAIDAPMQSYRPRKRGFLVFLTALATQRLAEIDGILAPPGDPAQILLSGLNGLVKAEVEAGTNVFRRIRQLSLALPSGGDLMRDEVKRQRADWANRVATLLRRLQGETPYADALGGEVEVALAFLADYAAYESESADVPWYMLVPIVNIGGLFFWDPSSQAFAEVGSALVFGPIAIPALAAFNIYLNPTDTVQIIQGKMEAVRALGNPHLSDRQRWDVIIEYGRGQVRDIIVGLVTQQVPAPSGTPAAMGWSEWLYSNRAPLLTRVWIEVLKGATSDQMVQALITSQNLPAALQHVSREVVLSALTTILGANLPEATGGDEQLQLIYEALIEGVTGAAFEQPTPQDSIPGQPE